MLDFQQYNYNGKTLTGKVSMQSEKVMCPKKKTTSCLPGHLTKSQRTNAEQFIRQCFVCNSELFKMLYTIKIKLDPHQTITDIFKCMEYKSLQYP